MDAIEQYFMMKTITAYIAAALGALMLIEWVVRYIAQSARIRRINKKIDDIRKKRG